MNARLPEAPVLATGDKTDAAEQLGIGLATVCRELGHS